MVYLLHSTTSEYRLITQTMITRWKERSHADKNVEQDIGNMLLISGCPLVSTHHPAQIAQLTKENVFVSTISNLRQMTVHYW